MDNGDVVATKKDVWLMRRELEIRAEAIEALVKQNHLELQEQLRKQTELLKTLRISSTE